MLKICFVCLGNICRSPMAEYIMKDKVKALNIEKNFQITSRATSYEEDGNDIYSAAKEVLNNHNIPYQLHKSKRLEKDDYEKYDYFLCMEDKNIENCLRIFGSDNANKIKKLLPKNIADPWYTREFEKTYQELVKGIDLFLENYEKQRL